MNLAHPSRTTFRKLALLTFASTALLLSACGGGSNEDHTPAAGDLVAVTTTANPAGIGSTVATRKLRYRMPAVRGGLTEANAMLFVPGGQVPAGGWPLVAWAHGTTGVADGCAPSRNYNALGDAGIVDALVSAGFAVVAPDYEGLDAPGVHPYFNRASHAQSVLQAVKAVSKLSGVAVSRRWAVMGHSQGGHVALASAQFAADLGGEFELRAAVAFAPGSDLAASTDGLFALIDSFVAAGQIDAAAQAMFGLSYNGAMVALGLEAMGTGVELSRLAGPQLLPLLETARNDVDCNQFRDALVTNFESYVQAGGDISRYASIPRDWYTDPRVASVLSQNRVGQVRLPLPVLLIQGTDDLQVPFAVTQNLSRALQANGTSVSFINVPGGDHDSVVADQLPDALAFLKSRL